MIRYIYGSELNQFPDLRETMFRDRADQFRARLEWEVQVDENGHERDEYDALNPLYVIWQRKDGSHGGSMRFLPTVGRTMAHEHFAHLTDGVKIESPLIWECTRFCLARDAGPEVSAMLMLGGAELGQKFGLRHAVGVFDARMVRIYRLLGWSPTVLGTEGTGREAISVGLWEFNAANHDRMLARTGTDRAVSARWMEQSLEAMAVPQLQTA